MCLKVCLGTRCSAGFCPCVALSGAGVWPREVEAAAGCHRHFITHLLIVANGDFTAPRALVVSCSSALMEEETKASLEIPSKGPCGCLLVHLDPSDLSLGPAPTW